MIYAEEDLSAATPATLVINRHRGAGQVQWSFGDFASKGSSQQCDPSNVDSAGVDGQYPVTLNHDWRSATARIQRVGGTLLSLKMTLPGALRLWEVSKRPERWQPTTDVARAYPTTKVIALAVCAILYCESRQLTVVRKPCRQAAGGAE